MDLFKELLKIDNYKEASIARPDMQTLVCDNVKGLPLRIVFKKRIDHWSVGLDVTAYKTDQPEPNFIRLMATKEVTDEHRKFWSELDALVFEQGTQSQDKMRQFVLDSFSDKPKQKKKA